MNEQTINRNTQFTPEYDFHSLKTLDTALNQIPAYQAWKSFDPGSSCPIDTRFAAMPALTKKDIRQHFPHDMLPHGRDFYGALTRGEIELVDSSGTTDERITNIWNQTWWDASEKASWKYNLDIQKIATGEHKEVILVNPKNVGLISDDVDLPMEKRRLGRFLFLNDKTDPVRWTAAYMDRMISELEEFQPAVLEANPSYLARLCRYIIANNETVYQPGIIVLTYEYPLQLHYRQISRVFRAPIASSYGSTETGYVFMQCEQGFFHQNSDFCRVDLQPFRAKHGGPLLGRILITPFNNPWSYIVRFDAGDIARLEESGTCPCGKNSGLILSALAGRKINLTLTCSGRLVTLLELDHTISKLENIDQYKLFQVDARAYELHLVSTRADKESLSGEAAALLRDLYGQEAGIKVVHDLDILPEVSGKYLPARALFPIDLENYLEI